MHWVNKTDVTASLSSDATLPSAGYELLSSRSTSYLNVCEWKWGWLWPVCSGKTTDMIHMGLKWHFRISILVKLGKNRASV